MAEIKIKPGEWILDLKRSGEAGRPVVAQMQAEVEKLPSVTLFAVDNPLNPEDKPHYPYNFRTDQFGETWVRIQV